MSEYRLLYRAYGLLDAKSIQLLLESFQVKSEIIQESAGVAMGFQVGKLGSGNVYVREEQFEEAEKIIALLESGQLELPVSDDEAGSTENSSDETDLEDNDEDEEV
jgi:hypothetical protein